MSGIAVKPGRRVIGSDLARHDAIEKVRGRTVYAADFSLPGMLHAMLKRSDYAHARLTRVDTSAAEAIDGVIAVYTASDVPHNTVWVDVPGQTLEVGPLKARSNVLAHEVVRYHGEPIALVAAETEAGVAWRDTDGVITIRAATQVVEHFRDVAEILDLPDNKVRLITPYIGGGFGGKEDMTVEPYLGIVVALTGRPGRMLWSRQESLPAREKPPAGT